MGLFSRKQRKPLNRKQLADLSEDDVDEISVKELLACLADSCDEAEYAVCEVYDLDTEDKDDIAEALERAEDQITQARWLAEQAMDRFITLAQQISDE